MTPFAPYVPADVTESLRRRPQDIARALRNTPLSDRQSGPGGTVGRWLARIRERPTPGRSELADPL